MENMLYTDFVSSERNEPPPQEPEPNITPDRQKHTCGEGWRVILFNDDTHTMNEVVEQLMLALDCSDEVAIALMLKAHSTGRATVAITTRHKADQIAMILRRIGLQVRVEPV